MDDKHFSEAVLSFSRDIGIGSLGEKTLHAVLKQYIEPCASKREVKVCGSVVDIFNDDGITEIQTRNYLKLRKKLPKLLDVAPLTIVLPLPHIKYLSWVDCKSGEITNKRKSPKLGRAYDGLYELSKIKDFLPNERLTVRIMLIDMEEYRNLDGWGNGGKRGSSRRERIPTALFDIIELSSPADYRIFIPDGLPCEFTLKEYMKTAKVNDRNGKAGIHILRELGLVTVTGKRGRENLYQATTRSIKESSISIMQNPPSAENDAVPPKLWQ